MQGIDARAAGYRMQGIDWMDSRVAGCRFSSISRYFELEEGLVIESLRTELQKLYGQHFLKIISLSGKLAPVYSVKVKKEYGEDLTFLRLSTVKTKVLRTSSLKLHNSF